MIKIILEPADNGVLKKITNDKNSDDYSSTVYLMDDAFNLNQVRIFIEDLCDDIGIATGGNKDKETLVITSNWGSAYEPTPKEAEKRIKRLEAEINFLKECV